MIKTLSNLESVFHFTPVDEECDWSCLRLSVLQVFVPREVVFVAGGRLQTQTVAFTESCKTMNDNLKKKSSKLFVYFILKFQRLAISQVIFEQRIVLLS